MSEPSGDARRPVPRAGGARPARPSQAPAARRAGPLSWLRARLAAPARAEGFDWDGGTEVVVRRGPGVASTSPGWTRAIGAGLLGTGGRRRFELGEAPRQLLAVSLLVGFVFFLPRFDPRWIPQTLLALQLLMLTGLALDRYAAGLRRGVVYALRWDAEGVTAEVGGREARYAREAFVEVVWEPVPWYGCFARRPIAQGAEVGLVRAEGPPLPIARALDPARARLLAERLARDLALPLREALPEPVVRGPADLDTALVEAAGPLPAARDQLRFASWREGRHGPRQVLTLDTGYDLHTLFTFVFAAENVLLPPLLAFDFVRWGVTLVLHGPQVVVAHWLEASLPDLTLHAIVIGSFLHGYWRMARRRRVIVGPQEVVLEVAGEAPVRMPLAAIEQVRAETFPTPAVRLVGDEAEILIDHLPSQLDAEALADRLPRLIASQREGARPRLGPGAADADAS